VWVRLAGDVTSTAKRITAVSVDDEDGTVAARRPEVPGRKEEEHG
jgi:hypothetical protein